MKKDIKNVIKSEIKNICGSLSKWFFKEVNILILEFYEYVYLCGKNDLVDVNKLKILRYSYYVGLFRWV